MTPFQPPQYHLFSNLTSSQPPALQSQHNMFVLLFQIHLNPGSVPYQSYNFKNNTLNPKLTNSECAARLPSPTLSNTLEVYSVMDGDTELTTVWRAIAIFLTFQTCF